MGVVRKLVPEYMRHSALFLVGLGPHPALENREYPVGQNLRVVLVLLEHNKLIKRLK
jgi:hypothetical protein